MGVFELDVEQLWQQWWRQKPRAVDLFGPDNRGGSHILVFKIVEVKYMFRTKVKPQGEAPNSG